jgi:hypothetical protein
MAHRTVRWCTGHGTIQCPVRATSAARWGLERLIVEVFCPMRPDIAALTCECALFTFAVDRCAHLTIAPLAHRTCPVHTGQFGEL